ncbi:MULTISPECIES: DUF6483 family protein [Sellimonas]|uniref:Uncharacterized protein n=1 Tax=Sellimonas caecigallum TaxID=2592333 RepID=A0ABS7L5A2_9FIRM|nr:MULTISPECIES: DUF6483 family protein [Sellimonas]MBY0758206.1 hypothetical protein [Sellimonas caecigallum]OUP01278.1 hypothetical protein B5F37_08175 [Drancourtella sp. An210]OUP67052.1 hypothetical protein B5F13_01505 [Drancourtella sp. An177]
MGLKQDFNVRRLEDQGRFLAKLILGKEEASYELPPYEEMDNDVDRLYRRILALADKGEINQAENELLESLEEGDFRMFEMALCFYLHLARFDADYLEEHGFSREEVSEGIENLGADFGVSGLEISAGA